jgi:hypothetical protein
MGVLPAARYRLPIRPEDEYITVQEARSYMQERYGFVWSDVWIRKLAHRGKLDWMQPGTGRTATIRIRRGSLDDLIRYFQRQAD